MNNFWSYTVADVLNRLQSTPEGLTDAEARRRYLLAAANRKQNRRWLQLLKLFLGQFSNPLVLLLAFGVVLSAWLQDWSDALVILGILFFSGVFSFWQEFSAGRAVEKLQELVKVKANVKRNGQVQTVLLAEVVPGDIVLLSAGDMIPADCLLINQKDLHVNEASLTGESFPVEKEPGVLPALTAVNKRNNTLFQGSSVISGEAVAIAVLTQPNTEFGKISESLQKNPHETAFEKGIRHFGYLLMQVTLILSFGILILNLLQHEPFAESVLFALALAVGLAPELLPAIITITLSAGAQRMAKEKVIVKKLASIQNLGAVDVFCADKTGTLTEGIIKIQNTTNISGNKSAKVLQYAALNAAFESGFVNPLDEAIRQATPAGALEGYSKFDEVPYDFIRKRLSIVAENSGLHIMITKGAVENILEICTQAEDEQGQIIPIAAVKSQIGALFLQYSRQGYRTIGVCYRDITGDPVIDKTDEHSMIFLGFIVLYDPPKEGITQTTAQLKELGIALKIITGDNHLVAATVAQQLGVENPKVITGSEVSKMSAEALVNIVVQTDIFAEIEPSQKEQLVRALQKGGKVVAYMGDGINDATALKAADVGISLDNAVDVAKEAADMVFLEKNLHILKTGIIEGRRTFINTLKYIFITTSANFGNMFSVAGASLLVPFLPLLPKQILLNNFLSDFPAMTIASDNVDEELLRRPRQWNMKLIRNFMMVFGFQSSLFDFITFASLLWLFRAPEDAFRTGWFTESLLTELFILIIIRTVRPFFKSRPSKYLLLSTIAVVTFTLALPYLPGAGVFGLVPLPAPVLLTVALIAVVYAVGSEITKGIFFKKMNW
ncbi:magnesium-translocating P-type ATPase [Sphingobacteriales bacterium UPWRP_1]|nr:magnesium-translocating P-type ATPase [Sphingobacteriales bacterium TSM_CSM]PSJ78534.1 magnesium-translocating P-type ATPase [Sphingobacteriales bacterium UPWRP_1]